ncbi:MAG TPA: ATP-binding protein [Miltoncostaeaceae bacterium]|nr:ATP-binding protein [Miltoncostaeaceae bacterium]
MTTALIGFAIGILAAAAVAMLLLRRARAEAGESEEGAEASAARAELAELRLRELRDVVPLVALRLDGAGKLVEVNRLARDRFPFLEPGMGVLEAFSEHTLAAEVDAALSDMAPRTFDVRLFVDGRRTYRASVQPYAAGGSSEALLLLLDASDVVDYQELRSQFVANVSHELRTPLTGLRALLEALADPTMDDATRGDFTARAASETQRLEALISDILFLSELEATQGAPSADRSDLAEAAHATREALADLAVEHKVALVVDAPAPVWTPLSDRMAVTVVRNLLENAVKYAGTGATATATVRAVDGGAQLTVSDDGAGIPERHLPHVFERFYRADPSRSKRLGGTGLGLSLVKHIGERFGGGATVSSREGYGTTITVTLPLAPAPDAAAARAAASRAPLTGP